jgi:hypothetical protein
MSVLLLRLRRIILSLVPFGPFDMRRNNGFVLIYWIFNWYSTYYFYSRS